MTSTEQLRSGLATGVAADLKRKGQRKLTLGLAGQDRQARAEKTCPVLLGTLTEVLDFGPSAPMAARRIVADVLDSWGLDHHVTAAQLCTTELVTDALRIGEPPLILVILHWTDRLLVTIVNTAEDYDRSDDRGPYSESRVRTRIIEGLSVTSGVDPMATGMAAWFDLDTQPPPTPLRVNNGKSASWPAPAAGLSPHAFN